MFDHIGISQRKRSRRSRCQGKATDPVIALPGSHFLYQATDYENAIPYLEQTIELADKYNNNQEYKAKSEKFLPTLLVGVGTQKYKEENLDAALDYV